MSFGGIHLSLRRVDLFPLPHGIECFQMLLRRIVGALRLHHRDFCVIDQPLRQSALALQRHAALIYLLRRLKHLQVRLHFDLRTALFIDNGSAGDGLKRGLRCPALT